MTVTLIFRGEIWNLLYLCQKWCDCHETKSKHINWTLCLKCDHQIWPWPWPWPWIFKVKYGICCISTKSGPIAMERKANISIQLQASNVTNGFYLGHDLDIWIFKVKCDLDHLVTKVRCKDLPDSDRGDFRCRCAIDSSNLRCHRTHYDAIGMWWEFPKFLKGHWLSHACHKDSARRLWKMVFWGQLILWFTQPYLHGWHQ